MLIICNLTRYILQTNFITYISGVIAVEWMKNFEKTNSMDTLFKTLAKGPKGGIMAKMFLIVLLSGALSAQDVCSKKAGCATGQNPLEAALSAPNSANSKSAQSKTKKATQPQKEELSKNENLAMQTNVEDLNKLQEKKKTVENPQYLIMWLIILAVLYFYLREKRKKGKK